MDQLYMKNVSGDSSEKAEQLKETSHITIIHETMKSLHRIFIVVARSCYHDFGCVYSMCPIINRITERQSLNAVIFLSEKDDERN